MATKRYESGAAYAAQVNTFTLANTWIAGETITARCGNKVYVYTVADTTSAAVATALTTAYNDLDSTEWPELAEMTASNPSSAVFRLTMDTAGKPFTLTVETNSAAGTINGGTSATAGTATTVNSGPSDVGIAANYSDAALPANGDTLYIDDSDALLLYNLEALTAVTTLTIYMTNGAKIGLPPINADAVPYPEYRPLYFKLAGWTLMNIGNRDGSGSTRVQFDAGTSAMTATNVFGSGNGETNDFEAVLLKGSNASNVINIDGGQVGVGVIGAESATIGTLKMLGGSLRTGPGVTLTTLEVISGEATFNSTISSLTVRGASVSINGTGAVSALTIRSGSVAYNTSGNAGTVGSQIEISEGGILSLDGDPRAKTFVCPIDLYSGGQFVDSNKVAGPVAQVVTYAFAGTWEADDIVRVKTMGQGTVTNDFVVGSTVVNTIIDTIVAAWNLLAIATYPELRKVTASRSGSSLVLTANSPGTPFVFELTPLETGGTPADAQTIEAVGVATLGTVSTANAGVTLQYRNFDPGFGLGEHIRMTRAGVA